MYCIQYKINLVSSSIVRLFHILARTVGRDGRGNLTILLELIN